MSYNLAFIKTEKDFYEIDALYQSCFGEASVPTFVQFSWWKKFPKGIIGLYYNELIIGGLSYWTLNSLGFNQFSEGTLAEKEISIAHINPSKLHGIYISEIALKNEFRHLKISHLLMDYFFEHRPKKLPILALAYSNEGRKILEKYGFQLFLPASKTADKQDLYLLE